MGLTPDDPLLEALNRLDNGGPGSSGAPFLRMIPVTVLDGVDFVASTDPDTMNVFVLSSSVPDQDMVVQAPLAPVNGATFTIKGDAGSTITVRGNGKQIDGNASYGMPLPPIVLGTTIFYQAATFAFDQAANMWRVTWFYAGVVSLIP